MDERTAAGPAALEGARSYRLCQEARRACGRAAELARWAEAAREAAAARAIEAQHARHLARVALEEAIAAGPVDRLN